MITQLDGYNAFIKKLPTTRREEAISFLKADGWESAYESPSGSSVLGKERPNGERVTIHVAAPGAWHGSISLAVDKSSTDPTMPSAIREVERGLMQYIYGTGLRGHTHHSSCDCGGECAACQGCGERAQPDGTQCCNRCRTDHQLAAAGASGASTFISEPPDNSPDDYVLYTFHLVEELVEDDLDGTVALTIYPAHEGHRLDVQRPKSFGGVLNRFLKVPGHGNLMLFDLHEIKQFIAEEVLNDTVAPAAVTGVFLRDQAGARVPLVWRVVAPADAMTAMRPAEEGLFITVGRGPNDPDREEITVDFPSAHLPITTACREAVDAAQEGIRSFVSRTFASEAGLLELDDALGVAVVDGLRIIGGPGILLDSTVERKELED